MRAALVLALFAAGGPAAADERRLTLTVSGGAEFNDNIFFSADDEVDDTITRLAGELKFSNRTERWDLLLSARVVDLIYAEEDDLDAVDQFYNAGAGGWLTPRLKARVGAGFARDSQPDRDLAETGLLLGTQTRETLRLDASAEAEVTDISMAGISWGFQRETYDEDQFEDYDRHQAGLWFSRRLDRRLPNTQGRVNLGYAHYDFSSVETDAWTGTLGLVWQWSELWHLALDGGARYTETAFDSVGGLVPERTDSGWGSVGLLLVQYTGERALLRLSAGHELGASGGRDGAVERTSAVLDASWRLAERSRLALSAGVYRNQADAGELAVRDTDEETVRLSPSLRLALSDDWGLEASYAWAQVEDRVADVTRTRNVFMLRLVFAFDVIE
ncbi:MAG: hypothetical protein AB1560_13075 [Pseudomonadota bacterium]